MTKKCLCLINRFNEGDYGDVIRTLGVEISHQGLGQAGLPLSHHAREIGTTSRSILFLVVLTLGTSSVD